MTQIESPRNGKQPLQVTGPLKKHKMWTFNMPAKKLNGSLSKGALWRVKERDVSCAEIFLLLDKNTRNHCYRVKKVAMCIGQRLSLDSKSLSRLALGALFHDIGKITLDRNILTKTNPLSYSEISQLRLHPILGARLWLACGDDVEIAQAILHHHEKFDGTGYPANLNGYDIPFLSRIIAVADALDAMISERFYQEPMQPEDALMRIEQDSGKHFDPDIVNKIIETYDSLKKSEMSNA